jgi:hypothetical protein
MPRLVDNRDAEIQIKEQGTLLEYHDYETITSTGSVNQDLTVPTGKKWLLKAVMWIKTSGTFTTKPTITLITSQAAPYAADGVYLILGSSGDTSQLLHMPQVMQLNEGDIVRTNTNTTAFTSSGDVKTRILVQEFDA